MVGAGVVSGPLQQSDTPLHLSEVMFRLFLIVGQALQLPVQPRPLVLQVNQLGQGRISAARHRAVSSPLKRRNVAHALYIHPTLPSYPLATA